MVVAQLTIVLETWKTQIFSVPFRAPVAIFFISEYKTSSLKNFSKNLDSENWKIGKYAGLLTCKTEEGGTHFPIFLSEIFGVLG